MTPMQIDTRNRDHGVTAADVTKCTNFTECAGYEPRQARLGLGRIVALYYRSSASYQDR
jgi:hypothetical protein